MVFQELKYIAREHRPKIKGISRMRKGQLLDVLLEEDISQEDVDTYNLVDYERLKFIRKQPRSVEILDKETDEKTVYHSIYSAGKALMVDPKTVSAYDGKIFRRRYEIKLAS